MSKLKLRRFTVAWIDSCAPLDAWRDIKEVKKVRPTRVTSCGYLIGESDEHISIASSCSSHGEVGGLIVIPKVSILKRK